MFNINNRTLTVLTTWPFLTSLFTLMVNDWWLKATFSNAVTGKLSDFSGVAVVALLLFATNIQRRLSIYFIISSVFLWWKSPASDPFIHFINDLSIIRIGRVIDYSDLYALMVLPLCHYVALHQQRFSITWLRNRKIITAPLAITALFAIMGTSVMPTRHQYAIQPISTAVALQRAQLVQVITVVAEEHGLSCKNCSRDSNSATFFGDGITMSYRFSDRDSVSFTVEAYPAGIFFGPSGEEKANALRTSLKSSLAEKFSGLEYVEPLKAQP